MALPNFFANQIAGLKNKYNQVTNNGVTTTPKNNQQLAPINLQLPQTIQAPTVDIQPPTLNNLAPEQTLLSQNIKNKTIDPNTYPYKFANPYTQTQNVEQNVEPLQKLEPNTIQKPQITQKQEYVPSQELQNIASQNNTYPNTNILSTIQPQQQTQVNKNIMDALSGNLNSAQQASNRQAFAAAAQNLRRLSGAQNAANIGQGGAAMRGAQSAEQDIMSALANQQLHEQQNAADMKLKGTSMATNIAQQNAAQDLAKQQIASGEKMQAIGLMSNEKLASDANWLKQQGIDQNDAQLFGYTDQNGNLIKGALQIQSEEFQNSMGSEIGQNFSNYITSNLGSGINDPAVKNMGQKLWESFGNTGNAPDWWVEQRIAAIKDPRLTNPIVGTQNILQEAVNSGVITQKQFDSFMKEFGNNVLGLSNDTNTISQNNIEQTTNNVQSLLTNQDKFDDFASKLPDVLQDPNLNVSDWIDMGSPSPDKFNKWYNERGGKETLKLKNITPYINDNASDAKDYWNGEGKYVDSGRKHFNEETSRSIRSKISSGIGEKEFEKSMVFVMDKLGQYANYNNIGSYNKKLVESLKKEGYGDKQIDDMLNFVKKIKDSKALYAFGYGHENNKKSTGFKLNKLKKVV